MATLPPAVSSDDPGAALADPMSITRPDPALLKYYFIVAAFTLFGFPFVILPLFFKYETLRYRFDDKGIAMSWGILWRREIYLTYRRIQDIHVTRNLIHRWLGLAAVGVQTASGTSGAEMTIEGIRNPEVLRDFLYRKMRGADGGAPLPASAAPLGDSVVHIADSERQSDDEALDLLRQIRDQLQSIRLRGERN
jgi:uncharacterized protein